MRTRTPKWYTKATLISAAEKWADGTPWYKIAENLGCVGETIANAVRAATDDYPEIKEIYELGASRRTSNHKYKEYKNPLPEYCFDQLVSERIAKRSKVVHPVKTLDQELTGTPTACRSALNDFETDGRGNVSKREPTIDLPPISIPSICINNNQFQ